MDHTSALAQRLLRLADDLQRNHEDPQLVCVRLESLYTDAIELDMHGALIPGEVMDKLRESALKCDHYDSAYCTATDTKTTW